MTRAEKIVNEIDRYYEENDFKKPMKLYAKFCEILPKLDCLEEYGQLDKKTKEIAWSRMEDEDTTTDLPPEWHEMMQRQVDILKTFPITSMANSLIRCNCGKWCKDDVAPRMDKVVKMYEGIEPISREYDKPGMYEYE